MDFKIIDIFNRSVTIELENDSIFTTDKPYQILLDGKLYEEECHNVVSIGGLEPYTSYEITVVSDQGRFTKSFTTNWESVLLNVRRFGAKGDGHTLDTAAIQAAIYACPPKGTVYLPKGTYRTTPVFLKSKMTLWLDEGAVLLGETDYRQYPILPGMTQHTDEEGEYNLTSWEGNPLDTFASLVTGIYLEHVDIIGPGVLDGNAHRSDWWDNAKEKRVAWRPRTVFFSHCKNVRMQNVQVQNSPSWTVHPYYCKHMRFLNLQIFNPYNSPNTDGFDPESCEDVVLLGSRISVGDDCVAIKSGKYYMSRFHFQRTRNIVVRNCYLERGHGSVTIGSEVAGGVEEVHVSRCIFEETDRGVRIKTRRGRGERSVLQGLFFENIIMKGVHMPLTVNMFYFCDPDGHSHYVQNQDYCPVDEKTPRVGSVYLRNVDCQDVEVSLVCAYGLPEQPIEKLVLENINAEFLPEEERRAAVPIMMDNFPEMEGRSFFLRNVDDLVINNVRVKGSADRAPEMVGVGQKDIQNLTYM